MGTLRRSTRNGKKAPPRRAARSDGSHPAAAKLALALREHKEALEQQAATAEILKVISSSPGDRSSVLEAILRSALRLCDAHLGLLNLREADGLRTVAQRGGSAQFAAWVVERGVFKPDGGAVVQALRAGRAFQVADAREGADYRARKPNITRFIDLGGVRTFLAVPLLKDREVIGNIGIYRREVRPFTDRQIALVKTFADQAVIAIENARLFNETKEALEQQTATAEILKVIASSPTEVQPVFDVIVERAVHLCGARFGRVYRYDGSTIQMVASHGLSAAGLGQVQRVFPRPAADDTIVGRVILARRPYFMEDIERDKTVPELSRQMIKALNTRSQVTIPMLRAGEPIGAITMGWDKPAAFNDQQVALLQAFADQAVIAIENVRLFNEIKEALERQTATSEILKVISASPTATQPVFESIVNNCHSLFGDSRVALWQISDGRLVPRVSTGYFPEPMPIDRESGIGACVLESRTIHLPDLRSGAELYPRIKQLGLKHGYLSGVYAPLLREGRAIGGISLLRRQAGAFSDKEVALLSTFADQAVIAIENARLFNETKEALEQQTATAKILGVMSSSPSDVQPVLDAVAESAARLCETDDAIIRRVDPDGLRRVAHFGPLPATPETEVHPLVAGSVGGRAVLERRAIHVEDIEEEVRQGRYPEAPVLAAAAGWYRSMLAMPLVREDTAIGVIMIRRKEYRPFTDKQIALLKTFADQAAIAIENVRLFNETREALERQTATAEILEVIASSPSDVQPVFDAIAASARRLLAGGAALVARRAGDKLELAAYTSTGETADAELRKLFPAPITGRGHLGKAILSAAPVGISDVQTDETYSEAFRASARVRGLRSIVSVPMLRDGEPIGVISVNRPFAGKFSEHQTNLLKTFADQAVIAIENVRLFNETKEALEQQTASGEVLSVISSSPTDLRPVFDAILKKATQLCDAHLGLLGLYDGERYRTVAQCGANAEFERWVFARGAFALVAGGPLADMVERRQAVHIHDLKASPAYREGRPMTVPLVELGGIRTYLAVPLVKDGRVIGGITVYRPEVRPFTEKQIALVSMFASQAVIAIENVRLFNETKEALEQQTAISEVLRVISSSPTDVKPVLDAVAERAARICDALDARIFLEDGEKLRHAAGFGDMALGVKLGETIPLSRGSVSGRAVLDRAPVHIGDLLAVPREEFPVTHELRDRVGHRTVLAVPLMRERRALGTIALRRMDVRPFTEKQIALLQTFADQAAIAIENVRLFNETREALEQQKASADVLSVISSSIADTTPVFEKILESCQRLFAGRNVGINVVGDDGRVHIGAYKGFGRAELEAHFPVPLSMESGSGAAILQRQVVHYPDCDAADVPEYARRGGRIAGNRSVLFAPMLWEGKAIGAIFVGRPVVGAFSEKEIALLRTFADQAAIAIQNARLFREIQEKSAQLEVANQHKSDFLANMSHELRTPLNAIIGFSEALMERMFGELNPKQDEYLKDIHESGRHLLSLINDILDLSKIEAGRMELDVSTFHLPTALGNAMTLIRERAQRHGIALGLEVDEQLDEFSGDERKFKQIMLNLLSNAVKFTPDGGRVAVSAKKDTTHVEIAVKDTGIGIAPEDQATVFEEFRQVGRDRLRKAEGTGLGLALTKRFVELHGGAIRLESVPGKGSTFTVSLPLK